MMFFWRVTRPAIARLSICFFSAISFPSFSSVNETTLHACTSAVSQTSKYVTSNRQLAQVRFNANAITAVEYEQLIIELDDVEATVSMKNCMAAETDSDINLYQCLATNKGNYAVCR